MSKTSSLTVSPLRIEISKISFLFENSLFDLFNSIKDCCKTFLTVEMTGFVVFGFKAKNTTHQNRHRFSENCYLQDSLSIAGRTFIKGRNDSRNLFLDFSGFEFLMSAESSTVARRNKKHHSSVCLDQSI